MIPGEQHPNFSTPLSDPTETRERPRSDSRGENTCRVVEACFLAFR